MHACEQDFRETLQTLARLAAARIEEQCVFIERQRAALGRIDEVPFEHGLLRLLDQHIDLLVGSRRGYGRLLRRMGRARRDRLRRSDCGFAVPEDHIGPGAEHCDGDGRRDPKSFSCERRRTAGSSCTRSGGAGSRRTGSSGTAFAEQRHARIDFLVRALESDLQMRRRHGHRQMRDHLPQGNGSGPCMRTVRIVQCDHRKSRGMQLHPRQHRGGGGGIISRVPQYDGSLPGRHRRKQFIDGINLLENHLLAQMHTDLRPQHLVARDEQHRDLGFFCRGGGGLRRCGFRTGGFIFSSRGLHRWPP